VGGRRTCAPAEFVIATETWLPHGQHHVEEVGAVRATTEHETVNGLEWTIMTLIPPLFYASKLFFSRTFIRSANMVVAYSCYKDATIRRFTDMHRDWSTGTYRLAFSSSRSMDPWTWFFFVYLNIRQLGAEDSQQRILYSLTVSGGLPNPARACQSARFPRA
jgi:hypothetical protein